MDRAWRTLLAVVVVLLCMTSSAQAEITISNAPDDNVKRDCDPGSCIWEAEDSQSPANIDVNGTFLSDLNAQTDPSDQLRVEAEPGDTISVNSPLTDSGEGRLVLTGTGGVTFNANVTRNGTEAILDSPDESLFGGNASKITTQNGAQVYGSTMVVGTDMTFEATQSGLINIEGTWTATQPGIDLTFDTDGDTYIYADMAQGGIPFGTVTTRGAGVLAPGRPEAPGAWNLHADTVDFENQVVLSQQTVDIDAATLSKFEALVVSGDVSSNLVMSGTGDVEIAAPMHSMDSDRLLAGFSVTNPNSTVRFTNADSIVITTKSDISFPGPVELMGASDVTLNAPGESTVGPVTRGATPVGLGFANVGTTILTGDIGTTVAPLSALDTNAAGSLDLSGDRTIHADGVTLGEDLTLDGDLTVDSSIAASFNGSVDGAGHEISLTGAGTKSFNDRVGGVAPPASITATGGGVEAGQSIDVTGDLTFGGLLTLFPGAGLTSSGGTLTAGNLAIFDNAHTISAVGEISGSITGDSTTRLTKAGPGTLRLSGDSSATFDGTLAVDDGRLLASGNLGEVATLIEGGTLGGTGTLGDITGTTGALSPGESPGTLSTGALSLTSSNNFNVEIDAPATADQVQVTGAVALGDATLLLSGTYVPVAGTTFTIVDNDGDDPVDGTFAGLAEGASIPFGGDTFTIRYTGGDGNDVTLTVPTPPDPPDPPTDPPADPPSDPGTPPVPPGDPAPPAATPPTPPGPALPPAIKGLTLLASGAPYCVAAPKTKVARAGKDIRFVYELSDPARVTATIQARVKPRAAARRACPPLPRGGPGRETVGFADVPATTGRGVTARAAAALTKTIAAKRGKNSLRLSSILGKQKLAPGWYRVLLQGTRADGSRSQAVAVKFLVLRR